MKKLLLFAGLIASFGLAHGQGYYYLKAKGTTAPYDLNYTTATTVSAAPSVTTDSLSAAKTLPFSWNFYGNAVTQFKASTSGYITFDASQDTDFTTNTAIPNANAPKNAIFAFWDNIKLEKVSNFASDIRTFTLGSSPNRVFVIQWRLAQAAATSGKDVTYFAIRLYEGADFDIVHNYGFGTFTATTGVTSADGSQAVQVTGSPNLGFGGANGTYDASKSDVYKFKAGTQPDWDASVTSTTLKPVVKKGNITVGGTLTNNGTSAITSFDINYSVDGGATVTATINGVNIAANGGTYNFSHSTPWVPATPGKLYDCKIWASNLNGNTDANPADDELNVTCFVNEGISGTKHVLLEEGSGGWCGYCPDGHLIMTSILDDPSYAGKVFGVVHHNADGMSNGQSDIINSQFATGYPYGVIDRTLFAGQTTIGQSRNTWVKNVDAKLKASTPVDVTITDKTYNAATRKLTFTVKATFADYYMGDLRLNAFVIEDKVRGPYTTGSTGKPTTIWTQHQYFSKESGATDKTHLLYNEPEYMVGYFHNHVVRNIPSTAWGTTGIIPNIVSKGDSYTQSYSYTLPVLKTVTGLTGKNTLPCTLCNEYDGDALNKPSNISIVGFVSMYDPTDLTKYEVLNVMEENSVWGTGVTEKRVSEISVSSLYPNPTQDVINIELNLTQAANVSIAITDVTGKLVQTVANKALSNGSQMLPLSTLSLQNGIYFMTLNVNGQSVTHRFVVAR